MNCLAAYMWERYNCASVFTCGTNKMLEVVQMKLAGSLRDDISGGLQGLELWGPVVASDLSGVQTLVPKVGSILK